MLTAAALISLALVASTAPTAPVQNNKISYAKRSVAPRANGDVSHQPEQKAFHDTTC